MYTIARTNAHSIDQSINCPYKHPYDQSINRSNAHTINQSNAYKINQTPIQTSIQLTNQSIAHTNTHTINQLNVHTIAHTIVSTNLSTIDHPYADLLISKQTPACLLACLLVLAVSKQASTRPYFGQSSKQRKGLLACLLVYCLCVINLVVVVVGNRPLVFMS